MKLKLLFLSAALYSFCTTAQTELITNGSFETGDLGLGDWTIDAVNGVDLGSNSCAENWIVANNSSSICCFTCLPNFFPTDGNFGVFTSFDSNIPDTQWILEQIITIPGGNYTTAALSFDFVAEFTFGVAAPITIPRELKVQLLSADGTTVLSDIFSTTFFDTGFLSAALSENIDILDAVVNNTNSQAKLRFTATIPESATGPSKAMLDNISLLIDDTLSLDKKTLAESIQVSPNPNNGNFTITNDGRSNLNFASIYDINGRVLQTITLSNHSRIIPLQTNLSSGIYLMRIEASTGSTTKKLIIK